MGVPQNGWFLREIATEIDDLEGTPFRKPPFKWDSPIENGPYRNLFKKMIPPIKFASLYTKP